MFKSGFKIALLVLTLSLLGLGFYLWDSNNASIAFANFPGLTDSLNHPPPTTGAYSYNSFIPSLAPGTSYVDPVFGSTVHRITSDEGAGTIYSANSRWNSDGTRYLNAIRGDVYNTATGVVEYDNLPRGPLSDDAGFDPLDPNVYYYFSGAQIHQITLLANGNYSDTVYFTAPAALLNLGGSVNWMDGQGKYMILRYGAEPSVHIFDRANLAAGPYSGAVSGVSIDAGGWVGISPDGAYMVSGSEHKSYGVSHGTRTVNTVATPFWTLCGSHGATLSASDGRTYFISSDCISGSRIELWRIDVTNDVSGIHWSLQKTAPHNQLLLTLPDPGTQNTHVTTVARGVLRDWAFYSIETPEDTFNSGVSSWHVYDQEIIAINVLTGEIRRLAHHRSRSTSTFYPSEPRVSTSWTGNWVGWASNFNQNNPVKVDVFGVNFSDIQTTPLTGDLNLDHIVNSLDWSTMNSKWFTADTSSDLNHDSIVNAIDFSMLNLNWFKTW